MRINEETVSVILGAAVVLIVGLLVVNYFRSLDEEPAKRADRPRESEISCEMREQKQNTFIIECKEGR